MFDIRKIQERAIFGAVMAASDEETAARVVFGEDGERAPEDDPAWVRGTMRRLESRFDRPGVKRIRMRCQCGYGMDEKLALVKSLMESSSSLETFAGQDRAASAGLFVKDGELHLRFLFCPCPMLAQVDRLETDAWCQCTLGYSKVLFEQAFGCEVEVELLKSIKMGDDVCLMKILPKAPVWQ